MTIHIDKLSLAFKLTYEFCLGDYEQFKPIEEKIKQIDDYNTHADLDFVDFVEAEHLPYKFNRTELIICDSKAVKTHFLNNYWVSVDGKRIALLQWKSYGSTQNYGYMSLLNDTLYNEQWINVLTAIKDLRLFLSHISGLDIAYDSRVNPTKRYLDIVKDRENEIIINGHKVNNRDALLQSPYFLTFGTLNNPLNSPQVHFATKDRSTKVRVYNKTQEIEENSGKDYIKKKFSENETIYRCEVSLDTKATNRILKDVMKKYNIEFEDEGLTALLQFLKDKDFLLQLHRENMHRIFRYSHRKKKRKTLLSYYNI